MKLITVAIPCYNSAEYMGKAIDSALSGGEDVEIIIVNDGSTDNTANIANEYAEKYPTIIKVIHQDNKGHGGAINSAMNIAEGIFFKVLDSDDWFDQDAFMKVIDKLSDIVKSNIGLDMMVVNYVYEKINKKNKKVVHFRNIMPVDVIFDFDDIKHIAPGRYMMMHSIIYRTRLLKNAKINLPEHTFYEDSIFAFAPLEYVKNICYLDVNLYRYYIGRTDQSVNEQIMISRIDQQLRVNYYIIDFMAKAKFDSVKKYKYMLSFLEIVLIVSSILLLKEGTEEALLKKKNLWKYLKEHDKRDYISLRFGLAGMQLNIPGKLFRKISVAEYKIARSFYGFN